MIDFTLLEQKKKGYGGANGSKICVRYDGEDYMLKFPPLPSLNKELSYTNSCISEYIGCHIFEMAGIAVQKTLLGTYTINGKEKIVVACKDFTSIGVVLQDFASLKNTIVDSEHNGYGTELSDILQAINQQEAVDPRELKEWFWNVFVVDAFIGNWDRHNGNWGFLYNVANDQLTIAPVYDCGSALYPQADATIMQKTIDNVSERNFRVYNIPLSAIKVDDKKINYYEFISSLKYKGCNEALKRIVPKLDLKQINEMIDAIPCIDELQKKFYKVMLADRKEKILNYSLRLLEKKELATAPRTSPRGRRI